MVINTKFNVNDLAWTMRKGDVVQMKISKIGISVNKHNNGATYIEYDGNWHGTQWEMSKSEWQLYATKDELLKSL